MERVLIIIPAFNEEDSIDKLLKNLRLINIPSVNLDLIVINDCSTDNTSDICKSNNINVINLPCNLGIGGAVQTGFKYAKENGYKMAIQMDGDGQHNPIFIEKLLELIIYKKADIVIGSRFIEKNGFQSTLIRRIGIRYISNLIRLLSGLSITDPTSGFRACNEKVIDLFAQYYPKDYPEPESIMYLKRNSLSIVEIPVEMKDRGGGTSSINLQRSIYYMVKVSLAIVLDKFRRSTI
jgi:glycosyltransferase involved in cell wall biosynthesis